MDRRSREKKPLAIIVDFDGTACAYDVGNLLFARFTASGWHRVVESWERGEIDSRECLVEESRMARATREELTEFVSQFKPAPGFASFAIACREKEIPLQVISDGFDYYIHRIFSRHKLDWIEVRANRLIFTGTDTFTAEFPYYHLGCGLCGNCKYHHLRELAKIAEKIIFIGDGYSDRFCAPSADMVFARRGKSLTRTLQTMNLPFHLFDDFREINDRLFGEGKLLTVVP